MRDGEADQGVQFRRRFLIFAMGKHEIVATSAGSGKAGGYCGHGWDTEDGIVAGAGSALLEKVLVGSLTSPTVRGCLRGE